MAQIKANVLYVPGPSLESFWSMMKNAIPRQA